MKTCCPALVLLLLVFGCGKTAPPRQAVSVFAAASLADALEVLADSFEAAHPGRRVSLNLAASSLLARQIEQGAPADVFFSASVEWMAYVRKAGRVDGAVLYPLGNRLVIATPAGSDSLGGVAGLTRMERIALAEPSSVPAGIYAKQALTCLGIWDEVEPRVIPTLDVRTALLSVRSRAADAAVVYASDLLAGPGVQLAASIPDTCHPDIRYAAALLAAGPNPSDGQAFLTFATDPRRRATWERYGFEYLPSGGGEQ